MLPFKSILPFFLLSAARSVASWDSASEHVRHFPLDFPSHRRTCVVEPGGSNLTDDAPAILDAFDNCGHGGKVVFLDTTYHVNSVMDTTDLEDCEIDLYGTLLWGTDIPYWLNNSIPVGYQNHTSAWFLGGNNVRFDGHGNGTLDGNGQVWYDFVDGESNYPGRPHAITFSKATNSVFTGLRFVQSQMWTMSIIHSHDTLFDSIYVNNTSENDSPAHNTDGADTIYSSNITFNNWLVDNGDDSISLKANSTNISITNSTFIRGLGIAIGSIGQYENEFEKVEHVYADNIEYFGTLHAAYFKTWTGERVGYPPNGGGGGLGYVSNMSFTNLHMHATRGSPIAISQCTTFSDAEGNCTSSAFNLRDLSFSSLSGTIEKDSVASLQCSAVAPCSGIEIQGVNLRSINGNNGTEAREYLCGNVESTKGFKCTGPACEEGSGTGEC